MTKIELAREEIRRLSEEIASLTEERKLWEGYVAREQVRVRSLTVGAANSASPAVVTVTQQVEDNNAGEYGSQTDGLRRFLVSAALGATMKDFKAYGQKHNLDTNAIYRFVNRMKKGKELEVRNGRYHATAKMAGRLEK